MGLLNSQMAADATLAFTDVDGGFAEQVGYLPSAANIARGVVARTINAIIVREVPVKQQATAQDVKPRTMVIVANDPVFGISSALIDYGGDKVSLPYRFGEAPTVHGISQRSGQETNQETNDPGMLCLEV